jgi:hypothetical protein
MTERTAWLYLAIAAALWLLAVVLVTASCGGGPRRCADTAGPGGTTNNSCREGR